MTVSMVEQFFHKKKSLIFPKVHMGRGGSGSVIGLESVSEAVFWAFFDISLLVTLEPQEGHTKFPISILYPR